MRRPRCVAAGLLALVVLVSGCAGQGIQDPAEKDPTPVPVTTAEAVDQTPQWVVVKYRDDPVDVSGFSSYYPDSTLVRAAWYDASNRYMVIDLDGTAYHYCGLPNSSWESLLSASSAGGYYLDSIKGEYDCRVGFVPSYDNGASALPGPATTLQLETPQPTPAISAGCPISGVIPAASVEGLDLPNVFLRIGGDADVVLEQLIGCFGAPTDDSKWMTSSFENGLMYCHEVDLERHVEWRDSAFQGLFVWFSQGGVLGLDGRATFQGYSVNGATPKGVVITTADGIGPGDPRGEVAAAYPLVEPELMEWGTEYWEIAEPPLLSTGPMGFGLTVAVEDGFVSGMYLGNSCGE